MKVLINVCYGGFGLSSKALLLAYRKGLKIIADPIESYFSDDESGLKKAYQDWMNYKSNKIDCFLLTVFSDDGKFVLSHHELRDIAGRSNPILIETIEELGLVESAGDYSELKIVDVPEGINCYIAEYDGSESVEETHRSWS